MKSTKKLGFLLVLLIFLIHFSPASPLIGWKGRFWNPFWYKKSTNRPSPTSTSDTEDNPNPGDPGEPGDPSKIPIIPFPNGLDFVFHDDAETPVPDLIRRNGYPVEVHHVVTQDGYILEVHRIPYGRKPGSGPYQGPRPVAFLQHGFLASSADWILNTVNKALAYKLADAGYDVFLGNARGNTYSRNHTHLSPGDRRFWQFSFHEMGLYDIPAVIDYILHLTGEPTLFYIGHSMGTAMFWVAMSERPEYNAKIRLMSALAPVAYVSHIRSPVRLLAPFATEVELLLKVFGDRELLPHRGILNFLRKIVCDHEPVGEAICENFLFLIAGFDRAELNVTMLPAILGHTPAGASTHTLIHFAQGINSKKFRCFDYGMKMNMKIYRSPDPPPYEVSKVTAPVALFWADNDWLAPPEDVAILAPELKQVVLNYRVPYPKWAHLDFTFGIDSDKFVYRKLMNIMRKY